MTTRWLFGDQLGPRADAADQIGDGLVGHAEGNAVPMLHEDL